MVRITTWLLREVESKFFLSWSAAFPLDILLEHIARTYNNTMLLLLIDVFVNFFLQKRKSLIVFVVFVVFIRKLGLDEALA